jgi:hypothetical protein
MEAVVESIEPQISSDREHGHYQLVITVNKKAGPPYLLNLINNAVAGGKLL